MKKIIILALSIYVLYITSDVRSDSLHQQSRQIGSHQQKSVKLSARPIVEDQKGSEYHQRTLHEGHYRKNKHLNSGSQLQAREGSKDPAVNKRLSGIARYILRHFGWGILGSISSRKYNPGNPYASVKSVSEGDENNSTGQLYFYISNSDYSADDLAADDKASFTVSLDQEGYCKSKGWDPQDPRCHWVVYTGHFRRLQKDSQEYDTAYRFLTYKHPGIKDCPNKDSYFIGTIDLYDVMINAGGDTVECIPLPAYFGTQPNDGPEE